MPFSENEQRKREISQQIILAGDTDLELVISTQVLAEFGRTMLQKFNMKPLLVLEMLEDPNRFSVVQVNLSLIRRGIELFDIYQLSSWDAMIISAAEFAVCDGLITEDLPSNPRQIGSVSIFNPFG